jgi:CCR4-NOT transcription complex subunit 2
VGWGWIWVCKGESEAFSPDSNVTFPHSSHLFPSFITPWADASAALTIEPDYHLPACYNVQPPPPAQAKANAFSDETLFFMFYSAPRDVLQEMASQEL